MVLDYTVIGAIFDNYINLLNKLNIFKLDANQIYENKESIIDSILTNIERKNNLSGITNWLHPSNTQFNNIAGFEPVFNNAGQLHSNFKAPKPPKKRFETIYTKLGYDEKKTKEQWHHDMLFVIKKLFHNTKADVTITSLNEEWHEYKAGVGDEFVTLITEKEKLSNNNSKNNKLTFLGNVVKPISDSKNCNSEQLSNLIRHRVYKINDYVLLVNIHTASNINGIKASDNIIELLSNLREKYPNFIILLGGDSNIYYGKVDKNGKGGTSDILYFYNKLKKLGYKLLISKHIVAKYRPYNFFQNAQSATKGGDWTNEETMFITFPKQINYKFNKDNYMIVSDKLKITDFHKDYAYGFVGAKEKLDTITLKNYTTKLYSDHMPIYIDMVIKGSTYRLIFSNNLSINTSRGVNNNMDIFKIKDVKKLERLSQNEIADFFIKESEKLYNKLGIEYENNIKDKTKYLKYLLMLDLGKIQIKQMKKSKKKKKVSKKDTKKTLFQKYWNNRNNCVVLH